MPMRAFISLAIAILLCVSNAECPVRKGGSACEIVQPAGSVRVVQNANVARAISVTLNTPPLPSPTACTSFADTCVAGNNVCYGPITSQGLSFSSVYSSALFWDCAGLCVPGHAEQLYFNGGAFDVLRIVLAGGGDFANVRFAVGNGYGPQSPSYYWVETLLSGVVVGSFNFDANAGDFVTIAGGGFDEIRAQQYSDTFTRDAHSETNYGALAISDFCYGNFLSLSTGDPHVTPFYTPQFPFTLPAARNSLDVYNYITLPDYQQNCRFIKYPSAWNGEYVIEVGMLIRDPMSKAAASTVAVGPVKTTNSTWSLRIRVDNMEVAQTTLHRKLFTVEQQSASNVIVELAMVRVSITLKFAHGLPYINLKEEALLPEILHTAHGLIGQTARPEVPYKTPRKECFECFVRGSMEDYRVLSGDLFGTDFKYNLFQDRK